MGSGKDGTVNSTRKGEQEELQRPSSTGTEPRRIRSISPQQRQKRKFQIEKDTKHRPAHTQHTQKFNELQIAQHLHHLTITHLQPSGTCFRSISSPLGPSLPVTVLSHMLLGLWVFIKIWLIKTDLVLEALIN